MSFAVAWYISFSRREKRRMIARLTNHFSAYRDLSLPAEERRNKHRDRRSHSGQHTSDPKRSSQRTSDSRRSSRQGGSGRGKGKGSQQLCRYFMSESGCFRGSSCSHKHDQSQKDARTQCEAFKAGNCAFKENCQNAHGNMLGIAARRSDRTAPAPTPTSDSPQAPDEQPKPETELEYSPTAPAY